MTVSFTIMRKQLEVKVCLKLLINAWEIKGPMIDAWEIPLDAKEDLKLQLQGVDLVYICCRGPDPFLQGL